MVDIFKNKELQSVFDREGLVTVSFAGTKEIDDLISVYEGLEGEKFPGFHASMFQTQKEYKLQVDKAIRLVIEPKLPLIFRGFRFLYGNFMIKEPDNNSRMKMHQDWTYVNEDQLCSLAIWFPLQDTNSQNGCIYFLKKSHAIKNPLRGPGIICPYDEIDPAVLENYLFPVPLKAGEAVIWDHRVLHASPPNLTNKHRLASTAILVPENEQIIHCYREPEWPAGEVEKFEVDSDFYMDYAIGLRPQNVKSLGKTDYYFPMVTLPEIEGLKKTSSIDKNIHSNKNSFLKRIVTYFR